jgi:hypothetical protein
MHIFLIHKQLYLQIFKPIHKSCCKMLSIVAQHIVLLWVVVLHPVDQMSSSNAINSGFVNGIIVFSMSNIFDVFCQHQSIICHFSYINVFTISPVFSCDNFYTIMFKLHAYNVFNKPFLKFVSYVSLH